MCAPTTCYCPIEMKDDTDGALVQAKQLVAVMGKDLPRRVDRAPFHSLIPFKALQLRELLRYRIAVLAVSAIESFEQRRVLPAVILARAAVETVVPLFFVHKEVTGFLAGPRDEPSAMALDAFLLHGLMLSRREGTDYKAMNITTLVEKVEKSIPGFAPTYFALCEYAHPNWAGVLGTFGKGDNEADALILGERSDDPAYKLGTNALAGCLGSFHQLYNELGDLIPPLNDHFGPARAVP